MMEDALRSAGPETIQKMMEDAPGTFFNVFLKIRPEDDDGKEERILKADMTKHEEMMNEAMEDYQQSKSSWRHQLERCPHCGNNLAP